MFLSLGLLKNRSLRWGGEFLRRASTFSWYCSQLPTLNMGERGLVLASSESFLNSFSRGVGGGDDGL